MTNLLLPAHDDPCDNHDGAFDEHPLPPSGGTTHHEPRKIAIEIDDGILLTLGWAARVTVTRDAEYEEEGQVTMTLCHHYADGKAVPFFRATYASLEIFENTLEVEEGSHIGSLPWTVQQKVRRAIWNAERARKPKVKPKAKRTTKRRK